MRKMFVASLLVAAGAMVLLTNPFPANAQIADDFFTIDAKMKTKVSLGGSLARMNASGPGDPDTTFIGHIHTTGARPAPYHGQAGGYGPFHVGSGGARYTQGSGSDLENRNGMWTFDDFQPGETDSLQGWWPYRPNYPFNDGVGTDAERPWWCLDFGNITNYVINQGAANKRTFGVVGAWHRDPGSTVPGPGTTPVGWSPGGSASSVGVAGSFSAWCGLRAHGDLTARDLAANGGTGEYFNENAGPIFGGRTPAQGATIKRFPGYNQQWDQMMYRDFFVGDGNSVTLSFRYRTRMSNQNGTNPVSISGWFDKDPLAKVAGNFISASATLSGACGANCPPLDSFMVYVGAAADGGGTGASQSAGAGVYSNSSPIGTIYDAKRRWFSEVLRVNEGATYHEMLSVAGNVPAANTDPTPTYSAVLSDANLDAIRTLGGGNRFRVVFRVKTNRFFDDLVANAYNSEGRGAAVIDDVTLAGAFKDAGLTQAFGATDGDFEAAGSINNDTAVSAAAAWKSTGKPPAIYFHREQLDPLTYADICGDPGDPRRQCNMTGGIIKDGDEDNNDAGAGAFDPDAQAEMQWNHGIISPVVNLMSTGVGDYNAQGIDAELADTEGGISLRADEYYGRGDLGRYGALIQYGMQVYPATNAAGVPTWGEPRVSNAGYFNPDQLCFASVQGNGGSGFNHLVRTSNANGIPDSIRVIFLRVTLCTVFGVTTDCSASDAFYLDNISVELIDVEQPSALSVSIWDFINDSFPANETISPASAAFDTTTAYIRSGLNIDLGSGNNLAANVPGDSMVVDAFGINRRVDLVFRIVPGPGNYVTKGNRLSGLRQVPTAVTPATANAASANFWESYLGDNGTFGTPGGHAGGVWSPHVWNSARIDTAEANIFPVISKAIFAVDLSGGVWSSTYHDADPKFGTLGILKNRCFLQDTAGVTVDPNIDCDAAGGTYPPPWTTAVPASRTGYPGSPATREYTKILPDGQFTPGTAVQYFFRASTIGDLVDFDMCPDTTIIFPQASEGSSDGHRWQQFGVLPDTWKEVQPVPFPGGGLGGACMLYVDNADRRGNERMFISVADSIGLTSGARRGAHNGWSARGDFAYSQFIGGSFVPVDVGSNDAVSVRPHYGQAGTVFDLYQVKASESLTSMSGGFGSRLSNRNPADVGLIATYRKYSTHGPTPEMLREFYRVLVIHTGDLNTAVWGPFLDRSDDDWGLVTDYTTVAGGTIQPRGVFLQGSGFVEYAFNEGFLTDLNALFNADYGDRSYTNVSGVTAGYIDLLAKAEVFPPTRIYGVGNACTETNDVLVALPGATVASRYEGDVYASGVKNVTATKITLLDGFNPAALGTRPDGTTAPGSGGRLDYMYRAISNVFGALCPMWSFPGPTAVGDNPLNGDGAKFVNFLGLRSANPMRDRASVIVFGLAKTEPAEVRVFDVTGRLTKVLANRVFKGGEEHRLVWDGTNDAGQSVARGVYFYQVRTPSYRSQKKLTLLAD
jgi:hypothetical protein